MIQRILHKLAYFSPGGSSLRPMLHRWRGVKIGSNVWISQYTYIDELHPEAVTIKDNCTIGLRTSIFTHFYFGLRRPGGNAGCVVLEKDVFIGPHCVILPNVHIGEGAVIRAGTVVASNVPAHTFWGPPAAGPLAHASVPLTSEHEFDEFIRGLKLIRRDHPPRTETRRAPAARGPENPSEHDA